MLAFSDVSLARIIAVTKPLAPEARSAWLQYLALRFDPPPDLVKSSRTGKHLDQNATTNSATTANSGATGPPSK